MIVTLQEARDHLRVTERDEDALITGFIKAAERYIEKRLGGNVPGLYVTPPAVPATIKQAALLFVGILYENRGSDAGGDASVDNPAINSLLQLERGDIGI